MKKDIEISGHLSQVNLYYQHNHSEVHVVQSSPTQEIITFEVRLLSQIPKLYKPNTFYLIELKLQDLAIKSNMQFLNTNLKLIDQFLLIINQNKFQPTPNELLQNLLFPIFYKLNIQLVNIKALFQDFSDINSGLQTHFKEIFITNEVEEARQELSG